MACDMQLAPGAGMEEYSLDFTHALSLGPRPSSFPVGCWEFALHTHFLSDNSLLCGGGGRSETRPSLPRLLPA